MKLFLAGGESRHWIQDTLNGDTDENISCRQHNISSVYRSDNIRGGFDKDMKLYLAVNTEQNSTGTICEVKENATIHHKPYILESFYYANEDTERLLPYFGDFLLDSGAFTFMTSCKNTSNINWDEYIERYADFVVRNNIQKFFELDIDSVVGYEKVKEYRRNLEKLTNRPCIPVWHKTRGMEDYKKMCDEYNYVAIGGVVIKEIKSNQYDLFPPMISEAHKRGAKVHGLGFTSLAWLPKCHFDSVDSTSWTTGNRFGFLYKFDGKTMVKKDVPKGMRFAKDKVRAVALNNYLEWIRFQKYAETHY